MSFGRTSSSWGQFVSNTKFRLTKFEFKTRKKADGSEEDVSELTLINTETKEAIILVLGNRGAAMPPTPKP